MSEYNKRITRGVILEVPYKDKDEAKGLGAWWDSELKKWFVPSGRDIAPFSKWIKKESEHCEAIALPVLWPGVEPPFDTVTGLASIEDPGHISAQRDRQRGREANDRQRKKPHKTLLIYNLGDTSVSGGLTPAGARAAGTASSR